MRHSEAVCVYCLAIVYGRDNGLFMSSSEMPGEKVTIVNGRGLIHAAQMGYTITDKKGNVYGGKAVTEYKGTEVCEQHVIEAIQRH